MSDPNFFRSDKTPKWSDNVGMLTIISNTEYVMRYHMLEGVAYA